MSDWCAAPRDGERRAIRMVGRPDLDASYDALRARVSELRERLAEIPETAVVGLRLANEPAFLAAFLACLEAERAVVLLDVTWKGAELARALAAVPIELLVTGGSVAPADERALDGCATLRLAASGEPLAHEAARSAERPRTASPLPPGTAVVHWSSGSTGRPKPLPVSRAALVHRAECLAHAIRFEAEDRTLCSLPLSHCHGIECLALPTLAAGAELQLMDPYSSDATAVAEAVEATRTTIFSALPRFYAELLQSPPGSRRMAGVRLPFCGSAALSPEVANRFHERRIRADNGLS